MNCEGGCFCGAVRYELKDDSGPLINCHCKYCRRFHGAAFVTVAMVQSDSFCITRGRDALRELKHSKGSRNYCGECGSRLFNRPGFTDAFLMLIVSSLDEAPSATPVMHINTESKAPWFEILDSIPQFAGMPPSTNGS